MILDGAGNLYGTLSGFLGIAVFKLTPSGSSWILNILFASRLGGDTPTLTGLLMDGAGNLYGTTSGGGYGGGGTVFELTPAEGSWTYSRLYSFTGGGGPGSSLVMDAAGSLYGTTFGDGPYQCMYSPCGNIFKLARSGSGWTYTSLHDFNFHRIEDIKDDGSNPDGANPYGGVLLDSNGNLYGTTSGGGHWTWSECGAYGCGVVWEIRH